MFTIGAQVSIRSRAILKAALRNKRGGIRNQNSASSALSAVDKELLRMQILRAKPEDAAVLTEIAHAAKRHWGYPERWIQNWRDILTMRPEFIAANVTYCAREDARAVGFYLLTNESDGLHLDHLWIMPQAM